MGHGETGGQSAERLVPIDEVARRLGLTASTIRYYDQLGLVTPASRHSGRRWYDAAGIRKLAVVRYWQRVGMLSLDDITAILAGPQRDRRWDQILGAHLSEIETKIGQLRAAADLLEHILEHHPDEAPDGCVHYEALIFGHEPATTLVKTYWDPRRTGLD